MDIDPDIESGLLPLLLDPLCQSGLGSLNLLFNLSRVDPPILYETGKGHPRHLSSQRVKAGEDDHLRRIIDEEFDPGEGLEGLDVPPLASDDPPLELLRGDGNRTDGLLLNIFSGVALHGRGKDPCRALFRLLFGPTLNLLHLAGEEAL